MIGIYSFAAERRHTFCVSSSLPLRFWLKVFSTAGDSHQKRSSSRAVCVECGCASAPLGLWCGEVKWAAISAPVECWMLNKGYGEITCRSGGGGGMNAWWFCSATGNTNKAVGMCVYLSCVCVYVLGSYFGWRVSLTDSWTRPICLLGLHIEYALNLYISSIVFLVIA
uniref:Uncharacterized protein TCIL3000_8_3480 n=1 Tax=Trypanosoma congolense (strain IL3000) TaxID=1068625 RepID=G0URW7_TRYCI|nr:unnamed protein product [Trypanosoma congolense IL3000]